MPIAEPVSSPLWTAVQGRVRWPTADEDATARLGRDWDDGVATFRYAASSTKELPDTAWPDEVGAVFDQRIRVLRDRAYEDADAMARLARITHAYGEDVGHAKAEIVRVLGPWDAAYRQNPEVAEGFAGLVNAFLQQMADRILDRGGEGPAFTDPPPPGLLTPDDVIELAALPPLPGGFKNGVDGKEVDDINRSYGGTRLLNGSWDNTLVNASRYTSFYDKAAVVLRDIAGGHMFDNGNKRTAQAVVELLIQRNGIASAPTPAELRAVVDAVGKGQLRTVEEISRALRGY